MEFGIFDHADRSGASLHQLYEDRLKLTEAYDRLGFYCYHLAEHHFTPLGTAASPGILLSSVAQRTKTLRLGSMVYILPNYHPFRLAEEICMLDQLSGGRLDVGIGRGISPIEARNYGESSDPSVSKQVFADTLRILTEALSGQPVTFEGKYQRAEDVQFSLETIQKPHPPFWVGVNTLENAETAARSGAHFLTLLSPAEMGTRVRRYREVVSALGHADRLPATKMGLALFIVVGETDEQARRVAERAYNVWHRSFYYLFRKHGTNPVLVSRPPSYAELEAGGWGIAGSPTTVRDFLSKAIEESEANYTVGQFVFGDMSLSEGLASIELFAREVMPSLRTASRENAA